MAVPIYTPAVSVRLLKQVQRQDGVAARYAGAARDIDLTPYLGEVGGVRTAKSLSEPAGGFTVALADQFSPQIQDSLYALIEPMDIIEIRAAREPHLYAGQPLPLIMRGFVSAVRRSESIGSDGKPQRTVVVVGQDAGKLWMIHQVFSEVMVALDQPFLDFFRLQAATGIDVAYMPVAQFMRQVTERVLNDKIGRMVAYSSSQFAKFRMNVDGVKRGIVSAARMAPFQGPIWGLLEQFVDRPWNELFVEDEEEGPVLRFREAPWRGLDGAFIMPDAVDPGTISLTAKDIVQLDVMRTDSRVANFFWCDPGASLLDTNQYVTAEALLRGGPFDFQHGNNRPELYGIKRMQASTSLLPNDFRSLPGTLPDSERAATANRAVLWHQERALQLKAANRDNSVFEEGDAKVKGHEDLRIGRFLRLTRGSITSEAYITRVSHSISPTAAAAWTTDLALERGTGFYERNRYAGSPFWAEGREGPYTP